MKKIVDLMEKYKHDVALLILVVGAAYTIGVFAEAPENGYWAGQTLDPACTPGKLIVWCRRRGSLMTRGICIVIKKE